MQSSTFGAELTALKMTTEKVIEVRYFFKSREGRKKKKVAFQFISFGKCSNFFFPFLDSAFTGEYKSISLYDLEQKHLGKCTGEMKKNGGDKRARGE